MKRSYWDHIGYVGTMSTSGKYLWVVIGITISITVALVIFGQISHVPHPHTYHHKLPDIDLQHMLNK